jgi:hypothetical protein
MSETNQQTESAPSLSIQDLIQVVKIIQVTSQRGAIQANEMSSVGALYDRLLSFLEANGAVERAPAAQNPSEEKQDA